ncbi:hypothetical protein R1flu_000221 [Riccia fluitans]|uniref:EF-hand domain-containing protein n=1 Tax=Riccia fluitans TaxID=41844 RepID=A0ABD1XZT5_9MARC
MAVASSGTGAAKFTDSGYFFGLFEALAIRANLKQQLETKTPLLKTASPKAEQPVVEKKSSSMLVENRCNQDEQISASECTRTGLQGESAIQSPELRRMFSAIDENQDGLICVDDLRRFMGRLGQELSEEDAVSMLATVDHDRDGSVGFEEFCTLYESLDSCLAGRKKVDDEEDDELKEAFRLYDTNNDGYISCQELQAVLLALGLTEGKSLKSCEHMIRVVDMDGNGQVDIKEFKQMMSSDSFLR